MNSTRADETPTPSTSDTRRSGRTASTPSRALLVTLQAGSRDRAVHGGADGAIRSGVSLPMLSKVEKESGDDMRVFAQDQPLSSSPDALIPSLDPASLHHLLRSHSNPPPPRPDPNRARIPSASERLLLSSLRKSDRRRAEGEGKVQVEKLILRDRVGSNDASRGWEEAGPSGVDVEELPGQDTTIVGIDRKRSSLMVLGVEHGERDSGGDPGSTPVACIVKLAEDGATDVSMSDTNGNLSQLTSVTDPGGNPAIGPTLDGPNDGRLWRLGSAAYGYAIGSSSASTSAGISTIPVEQGSRARAGEVLDDIPAATVDQRPSNSTPIEGFVSDTDFSLTIGQTGSTWWNYVPVYGRTSVQPIASSPPADLVGPSTPRESVVDAQSPGEPPEERTTALEVTPHPTHDSHPVGWSSWRPWNARQVEPPGTTSTASPSLFEDALMAPPEECPISMLPDVQPTPDAPTLLDGSSRAAWLISIASQAAQFRRSAVIPPGIVADCAMTGVAPITKQQDLPSSNTVPTSSSPGNRSLFGVGRPRQPAAGPFRPNRIVPSLGDIFDRPPRLAPRPPEADPSVELKVETKPGWRPWPILRKRDTEHHTSMATQRDDVPPTPDPNTTPHDLCNPSLPKLVRRGKHIWTGVRRVVVVGVHGWFPQVSGARSMLGDPRTSAYYASMMGGVVTSLYEDDHGVGEQDLERITYVHLDGDGTVDVRTQALYQQFLARPDWIIDMRKADAVFFVGHSQGCVVATHIMARMLQDGHLVARVSTDRERPSPDHEPGAHVGFLAICGVHMGPLHYPGLATVMQPYLWFESAAARELFDFQDTTRDVSVAYQDAMAVVLAHGVKLVLLASLDDQVVPIYGAVFSSADHPNILRVLHVDGSVQPETDFMVHLLTFCLSLRNAGIDDQGLLEHLSEAVAGELRGAGHSSPGEEPGGYQVLVRYLLGTDTPAPLSRPLEISPFNIKDRNEYELPWILRGVLDDPAVGELFAEDITRLKETVLEWQPTTRALLAIKKRLEPMAGRTALRARKDGRPRGQLTPSPSTLSLQARAETTPVGAAQVTVDSQQKGLGIGMGDW